MKILFTTLLLTLTFNVNAQQPAAPQTFEVPDAYSEFQMMTTPYLQLHVSRHADADKINKTPAYSIDRMVNINFGTPLQNPLAPGGHQSVTENRLISDPEMTVYETQGDVVYANGPESVKQKFRPVNCRMAAVNMMMANIDYEVLAYPNDKPDQFDPFNVQKVKKYDPKTKTYKDENDYIDPRDALSKYRPGWQDRMEWHKRIYPIQHAVAASLFSDVIIKKKKTPPDPKDRDIKWTDPKIIHGVNGNEERAGGGMLTLTFKPPMPGKKFAFDQTSCGSLSPDLCELSFQINACGLRYIQKSLSTFQKDPAHYGLSDWINRWIKGEMAFVRDGTGVSSIKKVQQMKAAASSGTPVYQRQDAISPAVPVFPDGKSR